MQFTDNTGRILEVEYNFCPEEKATRSLPGSPAIIDYMEVFENGVNIIKTLPVDKLARIEKACVADYYEPISAY